MKSLPKSRNAEGVENIDEIIKPQMEAMVARGDLSVEIPPVRFLISRK